jgi:DNA-binding NarL/FixJ family response regulator
VAATLQATDQPFVPAATVKFHVSRPLTKLEVDNRVQIALVVHDAAGVG